MQHNHRNIPCSTSMQTCRNDMQQSVMCDTKNVPVEALSPWRSCTSNKEHNAFQIQGHRIACVEQCSCAQRHFATHAHSSIDIFVLPAPVHPRTTTTRSIAAITSHGCGHHTMYCAQANAPASCVASHAQILDAGPKF